MTLSASWSTGACVEAMGWGSTASKDGGPVRVRQFGRHQQLPLIARQRARLLRSTESCASGQNRQEGRKEPTRSPPVGEHTVAGGQKYHSICVDLRTARCMFCKVARTMDNFASYRSHIGAREGARWGVKSTIETYTVLTCARF